MKKNGFESDSFEDDSEDDDRLMDLLENGPPNTTNENETHGNSHPDQEYEEIPTNPVKIGPTHHKIDYAELTSYIYPVNYPIREYQFNIVKECLYQNVVCAIPTGTGKTFISSCVMMNYYRWFPEAKIIFAAPTRPLVAQQIKAAVGMTGISADDVAILLDKSRKNRPEIWNSKRVFFSTPQVIENDLKAGFCDPKSIVLFVVDEAHRTRGNYAYNNIIKFLSRFTLSFRILGLTATPGADIVGVQEIVDNLIATKIEIRTEESPDIKKYMKDKEVDKRIVGLSSDIEEIIDLLGVAIEPALKIANKQKVYDDTEPARINAFKAMESSQRVINNPRYSEGLKWYLYFILQILSYVGQMLRRLKVYGIKTFYAYLTNKYKEFTAKYDLGKSTNKIAAEFYYHDNIKQILDIYRNKVEDTMFIGHPKLEILVEELTSFFHDAHKSGSNSRVIIFTEMRESALEIVRAIDSIGDPGLLKPHIFIGQSREKEKFDDVAFREKNKPKGRGRKKKLDLDLEEQRKEQQEKEKSEEKQREKEEREARRTGLSESAQITGMSQKQQKELIQDFKYGKYNILVATSIGEEGLDIGEVDLIVCYDATSSPIKNIQRMGRTGRNKDGKVLLLLTDLENTKFTRSMNSYEVVQSQITSENHIMYHESDRIIPLQYKPICEKKYIPEDEEFINEDEDDKIIKIATQHMNGKAPKKKKNSGKQRTQCIETLLLKPKPKKRFFMPDNVETGFKNVSSMVKKKGADLPLSKENTIALSDNDSDYQKNSGNSKSNTKQKKRKSDIMDLLDLSDEENNNPQRSKRILVEPPLRVLDNHNNSAQKENIASRISHNTKPDYAEESIGLDYGAEIRSTKLFVDNHDLAQPTIPTADAKVSQGNVNDAFPIDEFSDNNDNDDDFDEDSKSASSIVGCHTSYHYAMEETSSVSPMEPEAIDHHSISHNNENRGKNPVSILDGESDDDEVSVVLAKDQNLESGDEVCIEKVVKKKSGRDITSLIKNTIGAIGIRNNRIVTNTLKRHSLGVRKRMVDKAKPVEKTSDEELIKMMRDKEQKELEDEERLREKLQEDRERAETLKRIEKENEIRKKRILLQEKRDKKRQQVEAKRLERQRERERERERKLLKEKANIKYEPDLKATGDNLISMRFASRSGFVSQRQEYDLFTKYGYVSKQTMDIADPRAAANTKHGRVAHSDRVNRYLAAHEKMLLKNPEDGYKELRLLLINQKKVELKQKNRQAYPDLEVSENIIVDDDDIY